jgi:hypothetical protein
MYVAKVLLIPKLYRNSPDLDLEKTSLILLRQVDVDGKMGVDVSHLVLESLGHTSDHVVDERSDGSEGSDVLARAMVEFDVDDVLLRMRESDSQVTQVLGELSSRSLNSDLAGLDVDLDC